jgi:hypothetical protein
VSPRYVLDFERLEKTIGLVVEGLGIKAGVATSELGPNHMAEARPPVVVRHQFICLFSSKVTYK